MTGLFLGFHAYRAGSAGRHGETSLRKAEAALGAGKVGEAHEHLAAAKRHFLRVREEISALGPVGAVARQTPLLRVQLRAADALADTGLLLADGGSQMTQAAAEIIEPPDRNVPISAAIDQLRTAQTAIQQGEKVLDRALLRMESLKDYRLLGPLANARRELRERLPRVRERAASADRGLGAMIVFSGGSGPRRYLLFSQNPDEIRPTGGFIGTYGVLSTTDGRLSLERYEGIETWLQAHPDIVVPPDQVGSPLRFDSQPRQSLANVNTGPEWPQAAAFAREIWKGGGEAPVDGVLSLTPGFLRDALNIIGPVEVPSYGETVRAQNIIARLDFHTHEETPGPGGRKDFVAAVAEVVMRRVLDAPASQWRKLAIAMGDGFNSRELMAWSSDPEVQQALEERHWDGRLPATAGDFFYGGEFAYAAKNGRALRRTYDHQVVLNKDGSARVTTKVTIADPNPPARFNPDSLSYITLYGPLGATLDVGASEPPDSPEPSIAGHPAAGWFRAALPQGETSITVAWNVPRLAVREGDDWVYGLVWRALPDHEGDVLKLSVELPKGWEWKGKPPPATVNVDRDLIGVWSYGPG